MSKASNFSTPEAPSYNHFLFRRDAIEVCLGIAAWGCAERHAAALEDFARPEPTPWTDYIVARGRALAASAAAAETTI